MPPRSRKGAISGRKRLVERKMLRYNTGRKMQTKEGVEIAAAT